MVVYLLTDQSIKIVSQLSHAMLQSMSPLVCLVLQTPVILLSLDSFG